MNAITFFKYRNKNHHSAIEIGAASYQYLGGVGAVDGDGVDQQLQRLGRDDAGVRDVLVVHVPDVALHGRHPVGG